MEPIAFYKVLHVFALFVLVAHTFMALANPAPENRKLTLMITGVASLLVLVSGFGMLSREYHNAWPGQWLTVKIVCWLGVSAIAGLAYRRAQLRGTLSFVALLLVLVALVMVFIRPF